MSKTIAQQLDDRARTLCPGLRVDAVLHRTDKAVLLAGVLVDDEGLRPAQPDRRGAGRAGTAAHRARSQPRLCGYAAPWKNATEVVRVPSLRHLAGLIRRRRP